MNPSWRMSRGNDPVTLSADPGPAVHFTAHEDAQDQPVEDALEKIDFRHSSASFDMRGKPSPFACQGEAFGMASIH